MPTILIKPKSYALFHYWSQPKDTSPWYPSIKMIDQGNNQSEFLKNLNLKMLKELEK